MEIIYFSYDHQRTEVIGQTPRNLKNRRVLRILAQISLPGAETLSHILVEHLRGNFDKLLETE